MPPRARGVPLRGNAPATAATLTGSELNLLPETLKLALLRIPEHADRLCSRSATRKDAADQLARSFAKLFATMMPKSTNEHKARVCGLLLNEDHAGVAHAAVRVLSECVRCSLDDDAFLKCGVQCCDFLGCFWDNSFVHGTSPNSHARALALRTGLALVRSEALAALARQLAAATASVQALAVETAQCYNNNNSSSGSSSSSSRGGAGASSSGDASSEERLHGPVACGLMGAALLLGFTSLLSHGHLMLPGRGGQQLAAASGAAASAPAASAPAALGPAASAPAAAGAAAVGPAASGPAAAGAAAAGPAAEEGAGAGEPKELYRWVFVCSPTCVCTCVHGMLGLRGRAVPHRTAPC